MKRVITINLVFLLFIILACCNQTNTNTIDTPETTYQSETADTANSIENPSMPTNTNPDKKINVVCTIFPQYDWVREILGDRADFFDLTLLLNSRIDLHSYQPSVDDIVKISTCDLFIHVGGESDDWVEAALRQAANPNRIVLNLLDILGGAVKFEEIIEGMKDRGYDDDHEHSDSEYDEHVWLSLKNAVVFCYAITDALSSLDMNNAFAYKTNLTLYTGKLSALDAEYSKAVKAANTKTLLFADRFPFRYLMDDYDINYYAAFPGCSAETEASFSTIIFLSTKTNELNLQSIMVTESADRSIAKTIINNTSEKNQQILVLNALQSISFTEAQNGATYLSIMESNLTVLKEALK